MTGPTLASPTRPVLVGVPDVGGVGVGHFMRVLALAQAWNRRSGRTIVVAPPLDDALARLLAGEQITHVAVSGFDATVAAVETIAREHAVTAIAVDGYRFGTRLERVVRPVAHAILAFDDSGETGGHDVDVLTDSTPGVDEAVYRDRAPGARLLLGPRYAPLRREFEPVPGDDERPPSESETAPIVLLAGGEPLPAVRGWFEVVADGLRAAGFGVRAPGISESWRAGEVAALMRGSRLAVSTGGSTSLELCRLGIPSLLVVVAPNQAGLAAGLASAGAARSLGPIDAVAPEAATAEAVVLAADRSARVEMARRGHELVDGGGAGRLVVAARAAALRLEPAGPQHAELLWQWANDRETRAASFTSEAISGPEHERWFASRLADFGCRIYVASLPGSAPLGQVRFETSDDEIVIGISIATEARGAGFAAALISAGVERARRELSFARVVAYVQPQNLRSRRAFLDAGFALRAEGEGPHGSDVLVAARGAS